MKKEKAQENKKDEMKDDASDTMEKIISLAKRRGFIFQGSEIYGGLAGTWDYGHLGLALKKNIEALWWKQFVENREDMYGIDSTILMNPRVWEASGHVDTFADPLVEDVKTKKRYRADSLLEEAGINPEGMTLEKMGEIIKEKNIKSPDGNALSAPQRFNMMFRTTVGSVESVSDKDTENKGDDGKSGDMTVYLRPETAQGMFVNFKNVLDTYHPKLPFGIAQIGRSFRNEIAPRDFLFRVRELEIMEFEYFFDAKNNDGEKNDAHSNVWNDYFEMWRAEMHVWFSRLGFAPDDIKEIEVPETDRAHYSKRTMDFYFKYPFGFKEIGGIAYRTDFDLKNHIAKSGADLTYLDPATNKRIVPHVIEPTFGLGRHVLAVMAKAYSTDELGGEERTVLKFPFHLAPIKVAVFPLLKNKPALVEKAREVYVMLKKELAQGSGSGGISGNAVVFDDNGNIGKRYRRQDEIGTPFCVTVDFETIEGSDKSSAEKMIDTVTIRDRDTGKQERVAIGELVSYLKRKS
jgi:glycyl-tRNA synthetase